MKLYFQVPLPLPSILFKLPSGVLKCDIVLNIHDESAKPLEFWSAWRHGRCNLSSYFFPTITSFVLFTSPNFPKSHWMRCRYLLRCRKSILLKWNVSVCSHFLGKGWRRNFLSRSSLSTLLPHETSSRGRTDLSDGPLWMVVQSFCSWIKMTERGDLQTIVQVRYIMKFSPKQ